MPTRSKTGAIKGAFSLAYAGFITVSGLLKLAGLKTVDLSSALPLHYRYRIFELLAVIVCLTLPGKRKAVRSNLGLILKRKPSAAEVLKVFLEYGHYWAELADVNGYWASLQRVYFGNFPPREKQFLGLTFHIGNFELFGNEIYQAFGTDFVVVAERLKPRFLTDYFTVKRSGHHIRSIPHDNLREILRTLRNGEALGVVCDRVVGEKAGGRSSGVETRLFGKRVHLPLKVMRYAVEMKIPLYIAYCVKHNNQLLIHGRKLPSDYTFENAVPVVMDALEEALRRYPYQWHVLSRL